VNNLAVLYHNMGKCEKAISLLQRASEESERIMGPEHPQTIRIQSNLLKMENSKLSNILKLQKSKLAKIRSQSFKKMIRSWWTWLTTSGKK
jgi:hypothetical protein